MKLLIITQTVNKNDSNLGFFCAWLREFGEQVEGVDVICNFRGEFDFPSNVRIFSMGKERGFGRLRRYINFKIYIWRLMLSADAIFVHMIPAWAILVWPLAFIFRKKIYLWYTHGAVPVSLRVAEKMVAKIFTASRESCRLESSKIEIVGHGIDTKLFKRVTEDLPKDFKLLSVSRISRSKDLATLILAVAELVTRGYENIKLDIIGETILEKDKEYLKELHNLVKAKKLESQIIFLGSKSYVEMPVIYQDHNIFLHASQTGSLDKAVLEALSMGLSVITSSEAYEEYAQAVIKFKAGDSHDLALKIIRLISGGEIEYNVLGAKLVQEKASISQAIGRVTSVMDAGL